MTASPSTTARPDAPQEPAGGHEPLDVDVSRVIETGAGIFLLLLASLGISAGTVWWLLSTSETTTPLTAQQQWRQQAADPGVEPNQYLNMQQARAQWRHQLGSYARGEDDRQHVQIPIERTMQILAGRELQSRWQTPDSGPHDRQNASPD